MTQSEQLLTEVARCLMTFTRVENVPGLGPRIMQWASSTWDVAKALDVRCNGERTDQSEREDASV